MFKKIIISSTIIAAVLMTGCQMSSKTNTSTKITKKDFLSSKSLENKKSNSLSKGVSVDNKVKLSRVEKSNLELKDLIKKTNSTVNYLKLKTEKGFHVIKNDTIKEGIKAKKYVKEKLKRSWENSKKSVAKKKAFLN